MSRKNKSGIHMRSVTIHGHKTCVSLEDSFWRELHRRARETGFTVRRIVEDIADATGAHQNLSSSVRCCVVDDLSSRIRPRPTESPLLRFWLSHPANGGT